MIYHNKKKTVSPDAFIKKITKQAGEATLRLFGTAKTQEMKSEFLWDCVTKADLLAEKMIVSAIKKNFPAHGIIAEESGQYNVDADYVWIIDPIDGTMNFSNSIPMFGTMVALSKKGRVILSAIYIPITKELFFAKKGKGAFVNGSRIHCSKNREFGRSSGYAQFSMSPINTVICRRLLAQNQSEHLVLGSFGCIAVNSCYVAAGRRDWTIAPHGKLHDFAPPSLILSEAGCKVTTLSGKPWTMKDTGFVAGSPIIHKKLLELTAGIKTQSQDTVSKLPNREK